MERLLNATVRGLPQPSTTEFGGYRPTFTHRMRTWRARPMLLRWLGVFIAGLLTWSGLPNAGLTTPPSANRWAFVETDCQYVVPVHRRNDSESQPAEQIRILSGAGTYAYVEHPTQLGRLLDDLEVGVWIRADRAGLQLLGRVRFPNVIDPETGEPANLLLPGETYTRVGQWQRLSLSGVLSKTQRPLRVLRAKLRRPFTLKQAEFQGVVLNIFGGPGSTEVLIGQVEQFGFIPPDQTESPTAGSASKPSATTVPAPTRQVTRLLVDGLPFFPRLIEHRGESFKFLKQLGFNTVFLPRTATETQLRAANRNQVWLVCPPPDSFENAPSYARILGWYLGNDHTPPNQVYDADRVRREDPDKRPLIAGAIRNQWAASRELDVLVRRQDTIGSSFQLANYGRWLDQVTQLARPGTPFWSGVQTELPLAILRQVSAITHDSAPVGTHVQAEQIRQMALAGVAAGARGLWFQSDSRLDDDSTEAELRRMVLELINLELELVKPWAMGGKQLGEIPGTNAGLRVMSLATDRSRLLIPTCVQPNAQFGIDPSTGGNRLVVAGVPESVEAFSLNHVGLTPVEQRRISGGLQIRLDEDNAESMVLLSEDALVINHINRVVARTRKHVVELEQKIADLLMSEFDMRSSRHLLEDPERIKLWESARDALEVSRRLRQSHDLSAAYRFTRQAHRQLNRLQSRVWSDFTVDPANPLMLPFGASFTLAAMTPTQIVNYDTSLVWSDNQLLGGDCEDLESMVAAGWRQYQDAETDVETYLALSPTDARSGNSCLKLVATPTTAAAGNSVVEFAPVWVNSAPVPVHAGQRYRVRGWVRIDHPIGGDLRGCTISDNVAGPQLAFHCRQTQGWESFEMVRAADRGDHLTITIALNGLGELRVDELTVQLEQ